MRYRSFPRFDWDVSEIGYGMLGMGGCTGSDDAASAEALDRAVDLGCTFFETALAYGDSRSETLGSASRSLRRCRSTKEPDWHADAGLTLARG